MFLCETTGAHNVTENLWGSEDKFGCQSPPYMLLEMGSPAVHPCTNLQAAWKILGIPLSLTSVSEIIDKCYHTWLWDHLGIWTQALTFAWKALPTEPDRILFLYMERKEWGDGSWAQSQQICRVQRPFRDWGEKKVYLETRSISPQDSTFWSLLMWVKVVLG